MKKKFALPIAVAFALAPFSGCSSGDDVIRLSEVTHSVFYAPLYLAENLGYFKDEGIKIELTNAGGADKVMSSVLSGDAEIGFCGPEASVYVALGGSSDVPTVFGQLTQKDGSFLVSRKEEPDFRWENLSGKEILAGRKGGVPAMTFEYVLKNKNITDYSLNFDVAFNLMTGAFEGGTADYCTMFEPTASEYQASGKGYIVASVGEASGEIPYTCFLAKKSWLTSHEDKVNGFLRAVKKAIEYAMTEDYEKVGTALAPSFPSTDVHSLAVSVESYRKIEAWSEDMVLKAESFDRLQTVIMTAGELERKIDANKVVDNGYVLALKK